MGTGAHARRAVVVWAVASACTPESVLPVGQDTGARAEGQGESSTGTADDDDAAGLPMWTGAPAESSEGAGASGDDDAGVGFIQDPDGGATFWDCDPYEPQCPVGEKCTVYSSDGGSLWNASKCVPVQPDPHLPGEACTVIGAPLSGLDTCAAGSFCWDLDPETGLGMCIAFCTGSSANPVCLDPSTRCVGKDFLVCLPVCDPIQQDCPVGCACYPDDNEFSCVPMAAGNAGFYGDPCEFTNVCQVGLFCANPDAVPGCLGPFGCCAPYCDTTAAEPCPAADEGVQCLPWYEEGQAPPGFESVGACALPA